ncbi:c-type cytochrome [Gallaecimonas kandeliae]|uniref:c-type cytochrome n=1 Tax=Gallaecimonas kandeliae TaxID=3029055 RepID=UPI00264A4155|nr:c-type cytochrome [Gallaecimonas kandeliae]WKE64023.1 c-type cytochrome [Gallaecimonas kandeliae]
MKLRYLILLLPALLARAEDKPITPRTLDKVPAGAFGDKVRLGYKLFVDSQQLRGKFVGNNLNCVNCHMDAGRKADAAPLWGAWFAYPAYRKKNKKINTFEERLQGCFQYSMNGKAPPHDSPELVAMSAYAYWLGMGGLLDSKGSAEAVPELSDEQLLKGGLDKDFTLPKALAGMDSKALSKLPGRGYPVLKAPDNGGDRQAGKALYAQHCAFCHGVDGQGQQMGGSTVLPPLWGAQSFNWGAGMHRVDTAAAFLHANMPLGKALQLTEQQAWDLAAFIDSHDRPQDPRFNGDVKKTQEAFHKHKGFYGQSLDGAPPLGSQSPPNMPKAQ